MKRVRNAAAAALILSAVACQGSFSSGPQIPNTIPTGPAGANGASPAANATQAPSPAPSGAAVGTQSFLIADVAKGISCQESGGFSCVLRFNLPTPAPSPSGGAKASSSPGASPSSSASASATPSPTPSPTATPVPKSSGSPGASASPATSPTPMGPSLRIAMTALPADAPKMVITAKNAVATTALVRIALEPSEDFTLDGPASATFTLPKDQIADRGFAIQLFEDKVGKHNRHEYKPLFTLAKSSLSKQTLLFEFTPPKLTLPKGHKYLIVLYGDQRATTPAPSPSASGSAAAPSPSMESTAAPSATQPDQNVPAKPTPAGNAPPVGRPTPF